MVEGQGQADLVVSAEEYEFGTNEGSNTRESEPTLDYASTSPLCPHCSSKKVWRDGIRYIIRRRGSALALQRLRIAFFNQF